MAAGRLNGRHALTFLQRTQALSLCQRFIVRNTFDLNIVPHLTSMYAPPAWRWYCFGGRGLDQKRLVDGH